MGTIDGCNTLGNLLTWCLIVQGFAWALIELASQYGRYGYRRMTVLFRRDGWCVNHKRVARISRREGLRVPQKQPKRGRLQLNDGSCVRLRLERPNHVWACDFVQDRTRDGLMFRMLTVIDEFTRECLAIDVVRLLNSQGVFDFLAAVMVLLLSGLVVQNSCRDLKPGHDHCFVH